MTDDYFDEQMVTRQRLHWTVATRRQLERWEPLVAQILNDNAAGRYSGGRAWWLAEIEHHFALVAARNLLHALDLDPPMSVSIDQTLREELKEGRDLREHWLDYMPVFNVSPRPAQPGRYRSGRSFAARNPRGGPDWGFTSKTGALLLPNVSAPALHQLLDTIEAEIIASDERLQQFLPPRSPSPWFYRDGDWSPKPT